MNLRDQSAVRNVREVSYTTARSDVFEMVPPDAMGILDVGCSNGMLGRSLRAALAGRTVCGVEFDAKFADEASSHLDYVVNADLNELDWEKAFAGRSFDCMIFADVLEHLKEPQQCVSNALQYLRPGGSIVVSLPNIRHVSALWAIYLQGSFPRRDRGIFDRTHIRWFTIRDAHDLLAGQGFKVSAMSAALRWGDRGGGRINRLLNRLPPAAQQWGPIREFQTS